jgi:hypothetical protein
MPNPRNPTGTQKPGGSRQSQKSDDTMRQWQETQPTDEEDRTEGDHVEIGDPVPESQRAPRARGGGQGETGEDEDLPDDDGSIEGSSSERH